MVSAHGHAQSAHRPAQSAHRPAHPAGGAASSPPAISRAAPRGREGADKMAAGLAERSYMELGPAPRAPPRRLREVSFSPPGTAPVPSGRYGDSAGGFCYRECAQLGAATRNRCVRW